MAPGSTALLAGRRAGGTHHVLGIVDDEPQGIPALVVLREPLGRAVRRPELAGRQLQRPGMDRIGSGDRLEQVARWANGTRTPAGIRCSPQPVTFRSTA